jgi:hypothetical protein
VNTQLHVNVIKQYVTKKGIDFAHDASAAAQENRPRERLSAREGIRTLSAYDNLTWYM